MFKDWWEVALVAALAIIGLASVKGYGLSMDRVIDQFATLPF